MLIASYLSQRFLDFGWGAPEFKSIMSIVKNFKCGEVIKEKNKLIQESKIIMLYIFFNF